MKELGVDGDGASPLQCSAAGNANEQGVEVSWNTPVDYQLVDWNITKTDRLVDYGKHSIGVFDFMHSYRWTII